MPKTLDSVVVDPKTLPGWAEDSKIPFVEPEYYEMFHKKLHPRFLAGSQTSINMSYNAAKQADFLWEKPFELITVVNMSLRSWNVHIPGAAPGQLVAVKVPPFGVLRGALQHELNAGLEGSRFPLRALLPPVGDCKGKQQLKLEDGSIVDSCHFFNCPAHPMMDMAHSIRMGYHFLTSLGEALPDPRNPDHKASYIPTNEHAEKEIWAYQNIDPRREITYWAAKRLMYLRTREAQFKVMDAHGESVAGR